MNSGSNFFLRLLAHSVLLGLFTCVSVRGGEEAKVNFEGESPEEKTRERIDFYKASWETWLANASFKGNYTVESLTSREVAEGALRTDTFKTIKGEVAEKGKIAKMAEWVLVDSSPDNPLSEGLLPDGTTGYSNPSVLSITNGVVDLDFVRDPRNISRQSRLTEVLRVSHRSIGDRPTTTVGLMRAVLTPLTLGIPDSSVFDIRSEDAEGPQLSLVKFNGKHAVKITGRRGEDVITKDILFNDAYVPPRLEAVTLAIESASHRLSVDVRLDDFVQCKEYWVPRSVRQQLFTKGGPSLLRQWNCPDLGIEPVTPADFQVQVSESVRIRGLKSLPPIVNGVRTIDISQIRDDLIYDGEYPLAKIHDPSAASATRHSTPRSPLVLFYIVFPAVALVISYLWSRFRSDRG